LPLNGLFEFEVVKDESTNVRQVFLCRDRVGVTRRLVAYTNNRRITGLTMGAKYLWRWPRFHCCLDGSSGGLIEEADLKNIIVP
jgi:hypothetical protein